MPAISESLPAVASLFTDVEGSTRLWEAEPQRMPMAIALHDALAREVAHGGGTVVKMIGDGVHAAFDDPPGDYAATRRHAEECLAIARALSLDDRAAATLLLLGYAGDALGDRDLARRSFEASADLARALHDDERLSFALNALAGHHAETGDLGRAEALFEESLALSRVLGDQDSLGIVLPNLARLVVERGQRAACCGVAALSR